MFLATMIIGAMIRVDSTVIVILSKGLTQNSPANIEVKAGDKMGYVGNSGWSTGPHLHWEIHPGDRKYGHGERLNPEDYI